MADSAGKQIREMQKDKQKIDRARRKAHVGELTKIAAKQARDRVRGGSPQRRSLFGVAGNESLPSPIDFGHKGGNNLLDSSFPSPLPSKKKGKKNQILDGLF